MTATIYCKKCGRLTKEIDHYKSKEGTKIPILCCELCNEYYVPIGGELISTVEQI